MEKREKDVLLVSASVEREREDVQMQPGDATCMRSELEP